MFREMDRHCVAHPDLKSFTWAERGHIQDMIAVAARPPIVAVAEPLVPVCADALGLLGDGRARRVEKRVRLSLPLEDLQRKALACVESCEPERVSTCVDLLDDDE